LYNPETQRYGSHIIEHLRASHCKPWRDSDDSERLDGENGLLLTPSIDHLFDRGFISFENNGRLLVSPVAHQPSLEKMGVPVAEKKQQTYRFQMITIGFWMSGWMHTPPNPSPASRGRKGATSCYRRYGIDSRRHSAARASRG
jgi:hypothetical protein